MMLDHLGELEISKKIRNAMEKVLSHGVNLTRDLKGSATTQQYTQAIIQAL
jgi:isocitrate dehydrogenase (NAD+)